MSNEDDNVYIVLGLKEAEIKQMWWRVLCG